jgi:hypothetical protein
MRVRKQTEFSRKIQAIRSSAQESGSNPSSDVLHFNVEFTGHESISVGTAAGDSEHDDNTLIRMHFKFNAPIPNPATYYSIGSLQEFDIAMVGIGAHVFECVVNMLKIGARDVAKITLSWLSYYQAPFHVSIDRA